MDNVITSTASGNSLMFSWYDYVLFSLLLLLNAAIGIYFACVGGKQATLWEYIWGKKELSSLPIALSLIISRISGMTLLALPADIYLYGTTYAWNFLWIPIIFIINYYVYLPVILQLKTSSVYEYLELRFNNYLRRIASLITAALLTCYIPIVMYLPALAFLQGLNINITWIVPFISMVCVFYTLIGGIKAVIWTDTLQFVIVIGAILTILFVGIKSAGGFLRIVEISNKSGRFDWDFEWSLTKRDPFWAVMFGMYFEWLNTICFDAPSAQKFLMLANKKEIKKVMSIFCIGEFVGKCFGVFSGLVVLAHYYGCDPITNGKIKHQDQLMPYYIMDVTKHLPGLSGFIIAGIYCAAASTMSTLLNGSAMLIYEDLVSHCLSKQLKDTTACYIVKIIVFILGVITTLELFFIGSLGGILPLILTMFGTITGTMAGIFTLGMLIPRANSKGAICGSLISFVFLSWLAWGRVWYKSKGYLTFDFKPLRTDECLNNITIPIKEKMDDNDILFVYRITYYIYPLIGFLIVFLVGIPISWLTNKNDPPVDKKLISPIMHFIFSKNVEPSTYKAMMEMKKLTKIEEDIPDTIMF